MSKVALEKLAATVEELRAQVAELQARLERLEPAAAPAALEPAALTAPAPQPDRVEQDALTDELMLAISAAVAAYLGERAHIQAVRLIGTARWSQQGRVSIQASHRLERN
jgi:methylmalonyl-CoA carboxyltransferase large subunit